MQSLRLYLQIETVLANIHSKGTSGTHMGLKRTQSNVAERFYWRSMTEDIKEWVRMFMILAVS